MLEIWAATPTPFTADGKLALDVVAAQAAHLHAAGVAGVFVGGTTGEFAAMDTAERQSLVEAWQDARPAGLKLGVHVGHTDLAQAQQLAAHAESCGADLVGAVGPYYGDAPTLDELVAHLAEIAAAAPATPFGFYHIPSMTGSHHRPSEVVAALAAAAPTTAAVKFTDGDLLEFDLTRSATPGLAAYFGRDELLPAALAFGAERVIGTLYAVMAPLAHAVAAAFERGEPAEAYRLHEPFRQVARAAGTGGGLGFLKAFLNRLGPDSGPARSPYRRPDDAAVDELAAVVRAALEGVDG
ncbi:MAG TPA: dihydrodipicolinate synthase family protein [Pseudonocardia sp.]|jgi:N-acetylneuraminate lyase|uniref:dihydrodipicolinate synthase family protein n=1 Tax=Pseudonocardia sp. TaxID=60912 RepID=UPI002B4B3AFC|nr:dihydrodipicolinate synthase family protein [Pseudonocardia sp.]HLU54734.1 dihydrodipicolinate synthase family protein [Pseudonocardia sp.]